MRKEIVSKDIGNMAEISIMRKFILNKIPVSIPFGNTEPYDLVIETNEGFKSIQVKNAKYLRGSIIAYIDNRSGYSKYTHNSYENVVDYIAIYCRDIDECYIVDTHNINSFSITLRVDPPKNNSCISQIRWAKDYLLDDYIDRCVNNI